MILILLIIFLILFIASPVVRCAVFHPFATLHYLLVDPVLYFKHKKRNNAPYGDVRSYVAQSSVSFGCGKTLSAVRVANNLYNSYNNKKVWCSERKKFVTQKIHIISNVTFRTVPFEKLISLKQFVQSVNEAYENDKKNDTMTVTYLIVDEAGSQFNSRQFKQNFDALFIKTLLTSRHFKASIILTSQRQGMIDALMRQITNVVIACRKLWRFEVLYFYDGYEIETAQNPALVQPFKKKAWFIKNKNFALYDTFELTGDLQKSCESGDRLSEEEILSLQCNQAAAPDAVVRNSKAYRKNQRRLRTGIL